MTSEVPKAIDLRHHISDFSRSREASPLKDLQKYFNERVDTIDLANGSPSPVYFPMASLSIEALEPDSFPLPVSKPSPLSWLWKLFGGNSAGEERTSTICIPKFPVEPGDLSLSSALQYGPAVAISHLQEIMREFTAKVYKPAYEDYSVLAHTGNTDGWHRAVATLCNKGEVILADEWTYTSALWTLAPYGVSVTPIAMDSQGMRTNSLRDTLENWDEIARGAPRPHVMYTVPIGQNPGGTTMGAARKKEIYDICVQYDVIIVEDDPYYFLQEGPYVPKVSRSVSPAQDNDSYIKSLEPTFLKFDYQGRVIRLDTFSKTIAPGCRLGWFTCNPLFAERLERHAGGFYTQCIVYVEEDCSIIQETTTQAPCGFSQALVSQLLTHWKHEGYIRWVRGLGAQYTARRDFFVDCLHDHFDLRLSSARDGVWEGCDYYCAMEKTNGPASSEKDTGRVLFSFVPPGLCTRYARDSDKSA